MKKILLAALIAGCLTGWATSARGDCQASVERTLENPDLSARMTDDNLRIFWTLPEGCNINNLSVAAEINSEWTGFRRTSCIFDEGDRVHCTFSTRELVLVDDAQYERMTEEQRHQYIYRGETVLVVQNGNTGFIRRTQGVRIGEILLSTEISHERDAPSAVITGIDPSMIIRPGISRYSNLIGRVRLLDIAENETEEDAKAEDAAPPEDDAADDAITADPSARTDPPPPVPSDDFQGFAVDSDGCTMIPGASSNPAVLLWLVGLIPLALRRR